MIREKALELMEKGIKVSHRHFTREEYLYLRGGQVTTEDGYYFADRFLNDPMFVDGWRVWEPPK